MGKPPSRDDILPGGFTMKRLTLPLSETDIRELQVGDQVLLNGTIVTGRDAAHSWLTKEFRPEIKELLEGTVIYHCGPVIREDNEGYHFVAAGPTTSIREEPYQSKVIADYGLRGIIGKGGMGEKTLAGLKEHGAVYFHAVGGAASSIAQSVTKVHDVKMLEEFGIPEALWVIEVKEFLAVVTMDSHGNSLHAEISESSTQKARQLISGRREK